MKTTSSSSSPPRPELTCAPRFSTKRRSERQTLGTAVGIIAAMLGKPLMAWQQHVVDIALEIDPETGELAYDEIGLTVPRQSGKTTLILAKASHRCMATGFFGRRQNVIYTAQTRKDALKKWREEFVADIESSPKLSTRAKPNYRGGDEHLRFENRSRFGIEAVTEKAGHGGVIDEAYVDEAFAQVDSRLEQAFEPAMNTRTNAQLWWISTMGWSDASPYLMPKIAVGRAAVASDLGTGLAYFEWSAPDDADPSLVATWLACMPALHRPDCAAGCKEHTTTIDKIQGRYDKAVRDGKLSDFRRAYLNQAVPKPREVELAVIAETIWTGCKDVNSKVATGLRFALDVAPDSSSAAIAVAGIRAEDDLPHIEITSRMQGETRVIDHRPGVDWVITKNEEGEYTGRAIQLRESFPGLRLVIAAGSAAEALVPALVDAGIEVEQFDGQAVAAACGHFFNSAVGRKLRHLGQQALDDALEIAKQRTVGDGAWAWGKRRSAGDITPLYAVTLALWAVTALPDAEVSIHGFGDLDMCDACGQNPHEDPDGDHDYLCTECREEA